VFVMLFLFCQVYPDDTAASSGESEHVRSIKFYAFYRPAVTVIIRGDE